MALSRFHSLLEDKINKVIKDEAERLANGEITTIEGYRATVGYIRGLRAALMLADDIEGDQNA